jgi:hypothetical protein
MELFYKKCGKMWGNEAGGYGVAATPASFPDF